MYHGSEYKNINTENELKNENTWWVAGNRITTPGVVQFLKSCKGIDSKDIVLDVIYL